MTSLSPKIDKRALNAIARQQDLRAIALGEAIRISQGSPPAGLIVRDAKVFYAFLRGRK